ncbi:MAG TPA: hypothetical protein VFL95_12640, partial [Gemmatimonadales bacterium]|nr:hypothetical protein [Gemmatimonadales bacterium]
MTRLYPSAIMVFAVGVAACGSEPTQPAAGGLVILAGDGQTARAGTTLPDTVTLRVQSPDGAPQSGTIVTFGASDGGLAEPSADTSDSDGIVRTVWTLGAPEGSQQLTIQAAGKEAQTLTATGESGFHAVSIAVADPGAYSGPAGCGLDDQQRAWCWPLEQSWGQDTSSGPGRPVQAAGGIGFTRLQGGEQGRMCGLAAAGTLYCWHPLEPGDPGPTPVPGMPSLVWFSVSHD